MNSATYEYGYEKGKVVLIKSEEKDESNLTCIRKLPSTVIIAGDGIDVNAQV